MKLSRGVNACSLRCTSARLACGHAWSCTLHVRRVDAHGPVCCVFAVWMLVVLYAACSPCERAWSCMLRVRRLDARVTLRVRRCVQPGDGA